VIAAASGSGARLARLEAHPDVGHHRKTTQQLGKTQQLHTDAPYAAGNHQCRPAPCRARRGPTARCLRPVAQPLPSSLAGYVSTREFDGFHETHRWALGSQ